MRTLRSYPARPARSSAYGDPFRFSRIGDRLPVTSASVAGGIRLVIQGAGYGR